MADLKHEDIEKRLAEIQVELESEDADVESLSAEVDELQKRESALRKQAEEKRAVMDEVANMTAPIIEAKEEKGEKKMNKEERAMYADALAEVIKGHATPEQRALLLTTDASGVVAVNEIIDSFVWTDWEKSPILSRIRKVSVPGNYAVQYEASATGAVKHEEGANAPVDETLTLGIVNFTAEYFKKWIKVSDRVLALRGEAFLQYLHDEFGHQLAKAIEDGIIAEIEGSTLTATATHAIDKGAVLAGFARLSDEATNPVAIMSKATYATIRENAMTANYALDPFEGLEVLFNNTVTGVLVGDLDGVVANFPEGEEFKYIVDEKSLAEQDLIKIVGKVLCDAHLVRPNGFAHVTNA